jgi:hypothetical protein
VSITKKKTSGLTRDAKSERTFQEILHIPLDITLFSWFVKKKLTYNFKFFVVAPCIPMISKVFLTDKCTI